MMLVRDIATNFTIFVGGVYLAKFLWDLISIFYRYLVYSTDWKGKWGAGAGRWAVVTGATDGIGREYALQLAKKGYSVLLVGRSPEKLKETSQEIQAAGGKTEELILDFSKVRKRREILLFFVFFAFCFFFVFFFLTTFFFAGLRGWLQQR